MDLRTALLVGFAISCHLTALVGGTSSRNPFLDQHFYINPVNAKEFDSSIATASGVARSNLQKMQHVPSAYWIDRKIKIRGQDTTTVEGILKDASSKSPPELVVLMFYDLPNRDCDAKASNGEICCAKNPDGTCDYLAKGDCAEGIEEYKSGYVDPFASVLSEYDGKLPVVLVLEPDGLANLATNIADPHCGNMATQTAYKQGVKYAVEQITTKAPSVAIYLDAAHGGWLGWENNLEKFMKMLKEMALPFDRVRGFATNVANYQALGVQCPWCPDQGFRNGYCMNGKHGADPCCTDPCKLLSQWNFGNNELNYAAGLVAAANGVLGMDAHVIIDTGRNGVTDQRQDCANWCNPRGAGTGVPSTTKTANTSLVDAYFWLKTPGESDGCSQTLPDGKKCPRFDSKCASIDSIGTKGSEPAAPEAGLWFDFQVKQLAENAQFDPPVAESKGTCPNSGSTASATMPAISSTQSSSMGLRSTRNSSGACAGAYQQCGGHDFVGSTCCQAGCRCSDNGGGYYSQCTPTDPSAGGACNAGNSASSASVASARTSLSQQDNSRTQATGAGSTLPGSTSFGRPLSPSPLPAWASPPASSRSGTLLGQGPQTVRVPAPMPAGSLVPATMTLPASAPQSAGPAPSPHPAPALSVVPAAAPPPAPAPVPLTQPVSAQASQQCAVPYGQCGGSGWSGPTCCDEYCTCQAMDATRSQCVPKGSEPSQASTVAVVLKDELPGSRGRGWNVGLGHFAATAVAPWAAMPLALVLVALAAGLVRHRMRHAWRAYATLTPDQPHGVAVASSAACLDVELA